MKEQKRIIFVVFLLVGVSVFFFGQNQNNAGSGKSIRITGIDPKYNGIWMFQLCNNADKWWESTINVGSGYHTNIPSLSNGILTGDLIDEKGNWNGSGSYFVVLILIVHEEWYFYRYISKSKISFEKNITEIPFSNFNFIERSQGQ